MASVYLVRYFFPAGDYGRICIQCEGIFSTFERAEAFVADTAQQEIGDSVSEVETGATEDAACRQPFTRESITENARYEIIALEMDHHSPDNTPKRWLYDGAGNLVQTYAVDDEPESGTKDEDAAYEGKYHLGDLVLLRANLWNPLFHFDRNVIGVIAWRPLPLTEWMQRGGLKSEWGSHYIVDFINSDGYLAHDHVEELGIRPFEGQLTDNLLFLQTLSEHYIGKRRIKPSVIDDLYNSKIFVEKVRMFMEEDLESPA